MSSEALLLEEEEDFLDSDEVNSFLPGESAFENRALIKQIAALERKLKDRETDTARLVRKAESDVTAHYEIIVKDLMTKVSKANNDAAEALKVNNRLLDESEADDVAKAPTKEAKKKFKTMHQRLVYSEAKWVRYLHAIYFFLDLIKHGKFTDMTVTERNIANVLRSMVENPSTPLEGDLSMLTRNQEYFVKLFCLREGTLGGGVVPKEAKPGEAWESLSEKADRKVKDLSVNF